MLVIPEERKNTLPGTMRNFVQKISLEYLIVLAEALAKRTEVFMNF